MTWAAPPNCVDANRVEVHNDTGTTSISVSYTKPAGSNQVTFFGIGGRTLGERTVSDVQMGGQAMTQIETTQFQTSRAQASLHYLKNPPSGAVNMTATLSDVFSNNDFIVWTCSDVNQTTPIAASGVGKAVSTAVSVTLGSVDSSHTLIDFFASDDSTSDPTEGADQTVIHKGTSASSLAGASYQAGSAGGAMTWTLAASDEWASIAAALNSVSVADDGGEPIWFP